MRSDHCQTVVNPSTSPARFLAKTLVLVLVATGCTNSTRESDQTSTTTRRISDTSVAFAPDSTVPKSDFLAFVETSWGELAIRSPKGLSEAGVSKSFGLRDDQLDDLSADFVAETQSMERAILETLGEFEKPSLTPSDQDTYGAYEWYLENQIAGHEFWLHDWPIHYFIPSYNQGLLGLFTQTHPLTNLNQADDFITRISQIERQVDQVIVNLESAEAIGVLPPQYVISDTIGQLRGDMAGERTNRTAIYEALETGLQEQGVNNATIADKLALAEIAVEESFFPAWKKLIAHLESIESSASFDIGVNRLPDGDRFYEYKLRTHTSTSLSPTDIHELGIREATRVQEDLAMLFTELGYPDDENPVTCGTERPSKVAR